MQIYHSFPSRLNQIILFCILFGHLRLAVAHIDVKKDTKLPGKNDKISAADEKLCNLVPKDVVMSRAARNQGFHRVVTTVLNITFEDKIACSSCWVMLVELIPNGMYIDLYQTKSEESFGGPQVLSSEVIDVESPAYQSPEHTILVYHPHPVEVTSSLQHTIEVELAIHLRYHRPSLDPSITSAFVHLGYPNVMMRCQGSTSGDDVQPFDLYQAPCTSQNISRCSWKDMKYRQVTDRPLRFKVPVGQQSHTAIVTILTIGATITGTVVLLRVIYLPNKDKIT